MKKRLLTMLFSLMALLTLSSIVVSAEDVDTPPEENVSEEGMMVGAFRPKAITVSPQNLSLKRGQAYRLTATPISTFQGSSYSWSSSNSSVAVVTSDGVVRGVSAGTTIITAQLQVDIPTGNYIFYDSCTVTVSAETILVSDMYYFCNEDSGFYTYGPTNPGSSSLVYTYALGRTMNYRWMIILGSDGYYTVKSLISSTYLSIQANNQSSGGYDIRLNSSMTDGSKWSVIYENGKYFFVSKVSGTSPVYLSEIHSGNTKYLGTSHTKNDLSSWQFIRFIPTGMDDVSTGGGVWYSSSTSYQYAFNFNTKLDRPNTDTTVHTGGLFAVSFTQDENDIDILLDAVEYDAYCYSLYDESGDFVFAQIDKYDDCSEFTYKVALCVGENGHIWLRQDPDGFWSYWLYGVNYLHTTDYHGNLILDPELAYLPGYDSAILFFEITPYNIFYVDE